MSKLKAVGRAMSKIGRIVGSKDSTAKGQAMLKKTPAVDAKKKARVSATLSPYSPKVVPAEGGGYYAGAAKGGKTLPIVPMLQPAYQYKAGALEASAQKVGTLNLRRKVKLGVGTKPHAPRLADKVGGPFSTPTKSRGSVKKK